MSCKVCGAKLLKPEISFGKQPPSNRFMHDIDSATQVETYNLSVSECRECCTVQLFDRMPVEAYRPRYEWLRYNEPEGHLDDVVENLVKLPNLKFSSRVLGISYKDQSTLRRMAEKGFSDIMCLRDSDFEVSSYPFGLETMQAFLNCPLNINKLKAKYGQADIVLLRHLAEHSSDCLLLLKNLKELITPSGYIMLEVPDSQKLFDRGNYPFIWEEHIMYLTEHTVRRLAMEVGAKVVWFGRYDYAYEDSLNVVLQFPGSVAAKPQKTDFKKDLGRNNNFYQRFSDVRDQWRSYLESIKAEGELLAVFGAGHLAVKFINFYGLKDLVDYVVDDHPDKLMHFMPGSGLPIIPSNQLRDLGIRYCVSTLNPESEVKVRKKITDYFNNGGIFISAFEAPGWS